MARDRLPRRILARRFGFTVADALEATFRPNRMERGTGMLTTDQPVYLARLNHAM